MPMVACTKNDGVDMNDDSKTIARGANLVVAAPSSQVPDKNYHEGNDTTPRNAHQPRAPRLTWYVVSNTPYMKDLMMDVLPTPWSPRKTSLYLDRGAEAGAEGPLGTGVTVAAMGRIQRRRLVWGTMATRSPELTPQL